MKVKEKDGQYVNLAYPLKDYLNQDSYDIDLAIEKIINKHGEHDGSGAGFGYRDNNGLIKKTRLTAFKKDISALAKKRKIKIKITLEALSS